MKRAAKLQRASSAVRGGCSLQLMVRGLVLLGVSFDKAIICVHQYASDPQAASVESGSLAEMLLGPDRQLTQETGLPNSSATTHTRQRPALSAATCDALPKILRRCQSLRDGLAHQAQISRARLAGISRPPARGQDETLCSECPLRSLPQSNLCSAINACGVKTPNDPSSATRPARALDCNLDAMAGFAAAHG